VEREIRQLLADFEKIRSFLRKEKGYGLHERASNFLDFKEIVSSFLSKNVFRHD
jgi:hypothetical protein